LIIRSKRRKGHDKKEKNARKKVKKRTRNEERNANPAPGPMYAAKGEVKANTPKTRKEIEINLCFEDRLNFCRNQFLKKRIFIFFALDIYFCFHIESIKFIQDERS